MKCLGCGEQMHLARANRTLKRDRILLFCPPCGRSFLKASNWADVQVRGDQIATPIKCIGCDKSVYVVSVNRGIPNVIVFCFSCRKKLQVESRWEECRRRGEGHIGYAPDSIVDGEIKGGH